MIDKTIDWKEALQQIQQVIGFDAESSNSSLRLISLSSEKCEILNDVIPILEGKGTVATVEALKVRPGMVLYAESTESSENAQSPQSELEKQEQLDQKCHTTQSKLVQAYEASVGQICVEFNLLDAKDDDASATVTVSKNKTLRKLKSCMLDVLGLEHVDEFRVKRNQKAEQFKDEQKTLDQLKFMSNQYVYIERGRPLRKGESQLKFYYFDPNEDGKKRMQYLFQIPVLESILVSELQKDLLRYLNDIKPDGTGGNKFGVKHIRLREKQRGGPGAIFQSNLKLNRGLRKFKKFRDGDALVIQKIPKPEIVDKNKNHIVFVSQVIASFII